MDSIVVIGGGLGGLFTGALLAKEGCRVTVLEKNKQIGGGLQTFYRRGVGFESGMHLLGGIRPGGSIYKLCRYLGIMDKMDIRDVDHDCMDEITYLSDGKTYRVPEGKENFIAYFQHEFPDEATHIRDYVEALFAIVNEIDFFYLRTSNSHIYTHGEQFMWPADRLIAHFIGNEKLRDVLAYMNPMYGGYAGHTPAYIHALINVLYISGPSRFAGNSQQMAEALRGVIEAHGGCVAGGDPVTGIDITDRELTAVSTRSGCRYTADKYVAAIHPAALLQLTDAKAFSRAFRTRIASAPNSYSSFCVYVVFKPQSFPYINHTCYYQSDYGMVWHYNEYNAGEFPRGFMYMTPCEAEQGPWATKMIINSIMPYSACAPWAGTLTGNRGRAYEEWKRQRTEQVLEKMERLFPGFRQKYDLVFASSPLTIRDYYNEPEGALYGLHKDCLNVAQSQVPVYTKVRNLYMTGQNVNLHGFCGVPLTAINTAEAIVGLNRITDKINALDDEK
jgi:all-trans-retinol 13,14-reductase